MIQAQTFEEWVDLNYTELRELFEDYLMGECDYSRTSAENSDDGRDEFVHQERKEYSPIHIPDEIVVCKYCGKVDIKPDHSCDGNRWINDMQ